MPSTSSHKVATLPPVRAGGLCRRAAKVLDISSIKELEEDVEAVRARRRGRPGQDRVQRRTGRRRSRRKGGKQCPGGQRNKGLRKSRGQRREQSIVRVQGAMSEVGGQKGNGDSSEIFFFETVLLLLPRLECNGVISAHHNLCLSSSSDSSPQPPE